MLCVVHITSYTNFGKEAYIKYFILARTFGYIGYLHAVCFIFNKLFLLYYLLTNISGSLISKSEYKIAVIKLLCGLLCNKNYFTLHCSSFH
jgi:hypothetical protein